MNRRKIRRGAAYVVAVVAVLVALLGILLPDSFAGTLLEIITSQSTISAALRLSVPIVFAALGGIFAEKSGVINIGLEGLLIISAFTAVFTVDYIGVGSSVLFVPAMWVGLFTAIVASSLIALLFAVVTIEFKADQIIAGLAVWLVALGLAPFLAVIYYGGPNSSQNVGTLPNWEIPYLSDIPFVGAILFDASPFVYMMLVAVPLAWFTLNRTSYGRWVRASGENPKALDTVGISVHRVRYKSVVLSGVLSGIGGAGLSIGQVGVFIGNNQTMVNGRGFIAIVAYLFGNYNPIGALGAAMLFAGLDSIQLRLQQITGYGVPDQLIQAIPFVMVIIALALVGRTRTPEAAGEPYETGED